MNLLIKKGICDYYTHTHTHIKCCLVMIFCPKKKEERLKSSAAFPESTALDSSLD
jgi:hypothetical protein